MKPYFQNEWVTIYHGDCREILPLLSDISAVVTDPPYNLTSISKRFGNDKARNTPAMDTKEGSVWARKAKGFMGQTWDGTGIPFDPELWRLVMNTMLPGGHLLSFGGSRTYHRMACAIEDAGFEIRDMINWVYGSGFPKSLDVGKAVDKLQGNERIPTGEIKHHAQKGVAIAEERGAIGDGAFGQSKDEELTKGTSEWEGWGTALKPAHEPICLARKPLSEKTVAENVLKWGTGAINVDGSRISLNGETPPAGSAKRVFAGNQYADDKVYGDNKITPPKGRFPANLIHDGSQEVMDLFPNSKGQQGDVKGTEPSRTGEHGIYGTYDRVSGFAKRNDSGSAARFFYCAKASRSERDAGLEGMPLGEPQRWNKAGEWTDDTTPARNSHPTVKPIALMRYLINLITPPNGIVLDPFMGSGSTLLAGKGFKVIGIEIEEKYCEIAAKRCSQSVMRLEV